MQVFICLRNKITNEKLDVVLKKTLPSGSEGSRILLECLFFNEIHFYSTIWYEIENFQKQFHGGQQCDNVPKFYGSSLEPFKELFVMENLKKIGYAMYPRNGIFDEQVTKLLMEKYGRFHGVSAAFREINPKQYEGLVKDLRESSMIVSNAGIFIDYIQRTVMMIMDLFTNEDIKKKLERYVKNTVQILIKTLQYNGKNPVVNHGDCWSSNMMFKFDVSII